MLKVCLLYNCEYLKNDGLCKDKASNPNDWPGISIDPIRCSVCCWLCKPEVRDQCEYCCIEITNPSDSNNPSGTWHGVLYVENVDNGQAKLFDK